MSVTTRYAEMESSDFPNELDNIWKSLTNIKEAVKREVEDGNLRPIDGIRAVSCLTGSVFGYEEFHPRGTDSPSLVAALYGRISDK